MEKGKEWNEEVVRLTFVDEVILCSHIDDVSVRGCTEVTGSLRRSCKHECTRTSTHTQTNTQAHSTKNITKQIQKQ